MNTQFNYSPSGDTLIITMGNALTSRSKNIYYVYALLYFVSGILFIRMFLDRDFSGVGMMIAIGIFLIFGYFGRSFLRKVTQYEELTVTKSAITLHHKGFMLNRQRVMPLERISHIFVLGDPHASDSGVRFDNSFIPGQREVELLSDKDKERIGIFYDGRQIRFGKGMDDANADYLIKRIREFTGNDFTGHDDIYEQYVREATKF